MRVLWGRCGHWAMLIGGISAIWQIVTIIRAFSGVVMSAKRSMLVRFSAIS